MRRRILLCCLLAACCWAGLANAQPANNECVNAIAVNVGSPAATGNITTATNNGTATCGASATNRDVWYTFTAPTAGNYRFTTCGTHDAPGLNLGMDTVLSALDMCGGVQLACNDDNGAGCVGLDAGILRDSSISLTLAMGQTIVLRVSHFGTVIANGDFVLNVISSTPENCANGVDDDFDGQVDCADADCLGDPACAPPANDECLGATPVMLGSNAITTINATNSPEPPPVGPCAVFGQNSNDVWYSFTATMSVLHQFDTCGIPGFDTDLTLYEGPCGSLVQVACNGDGTGLTGCQIFYSRLSATLNAGTTYLVRIGGFGAATEGTGTLHVLVAGAEDCADGIDNDFDGLTDCADVADCPSGVAPCIENCADGIDNDADGLVDCNDFVDCPAGMAPCVEICNDGIDNDTDGLVDCNDGECAGDANCVAGGNDFCGGALVVMCGDTVMGDTTMATAEPWPTCGTTSGTGGGVWYRLTGNGDQVTLTTCNAGSNYDTKIRVWSGSCAAATCVTGNDDAACSFSGLRSRVAFLTTPGVEYFILVHGFAATQGLFEMTVTCLTPGPEICTDGLDNDLDGLTDCADMADCPSGVAPCIEDCADGIDNDADGLVDCFDPDCSIIPACAPPANDDCLAAQVIGLGATPFDSTLATNSGVPGSTIPCNGAVGQFSRDVWFEFTPATTGNYLLHTCAAGSYDTDLLIYSGACGALVEEGCSGDGTGLVGCQIFYSAIIQPLTAGTTYLIRVGGFGASTGGVGTLNVGLDCGSIGPVTCAYDCATNMLTLNWTDNANATGYNVLENGVMVGSAPAGGSSFSLAGPAAGTNTYTIEWPCALGGMGTPASCTITIQPPIVIPGGTTDVILHLEGLQNAGALGLTDSGVALENALVANGRTVARVAPANFDALITANCLDLSGAQTLWVMTGTFPNDYRITVGEGDALAALAAAGIGIYFEAGDHWGFIHVVSGLDGRDGIDATGNLDGNDLFVSMNGANAPIGGLDLSANVGVAYTQDQAGNDFTDQLAVTGGDAPGVTSAEVIWTDATAGYNVGVIAVHTDGGVMISTSWEFGGYGGNQNALALAYLDALGRTGPVGDQFKRGDCNNDNGFNIADAVFLLGNLFPPPGGMPNVLACRDACDGNNDGGINIADAVAMLGALFPPPGMPSPGLPAPFGACGLDTGMDTLDCLGYNHCP